MGDDLETVSKSIDKKIRERAKINFNASLFVKVAMVAIGSMIVAIAQFMIGPENSGWSTWQVIGIATALIVGVGAIFVVITERDAADDLALAREALSKAQQAEREFESYLELEGAIYQLIELYQAAGVMRGAIETVAAKGISNETLIASTILNASARSLSIAMGFGQSDRWTICVYIAEKYLESERYILRCIAHERAIKCDLANARAWPEGTGLAGVCFSNRAEMILPNLQADGVRAIFASGVSDSRPDDAERYRSMVAVPVMVQGLERPWGVVTATNDQVDHFSYEESQGVKPDEGVRLLAGMVALGIAVSRSNGEKPGGVSGES